MAIYYLTNIRKIYGITDGIYRPLRGKELHALASLENAYLKIEDDIIADFGSMEKLPPIESGARVVDCQGRSILPGYCDSHTHIVFAKSRHEEFVDKIKGLTYEQIAAKGGGIIHSALALREMDESELLDGALMRLESMVKTGTVAVEIKSGYGLDLASELKMLTVIRRLSELSDVTIKSTFLGAHAVPPEFKGNQTGYVNYIIEEMLPVIADSGLADYVDVFCDKGFFTVEETSRILEAADKYGLKAKIHANELDFSGGVQVGVAHGAVSVDHLERAGSEEFDLLSKSNTIATLLPGTAFFLGLPYPDARSMIEKNVAIALASDFNPGSCPSGNMNFVMALACIKMKILPEEALAAATLNGAYAMEIGNTHGSIERGKVASFLITEFIDDLSQIPYYFSSNLIYKTVLNGKVD
ncbi:imidazolonepropionase [Thermaurantimonas aggregans]|uniref:Imidazolonepropionase n=1 Tax=Thermaurantimonas aggregans TaxID=2173829 RepID=A0A401XNU1_9FLAO|nr:imidazolonepropionase [Thermaurantimonas aggregans]MCX8148853.1 imidazolonepropionase [Thermaurantimonas aggregans]GCD78670.1 imidazolonepropionase [Thermaurantimonas aggregans]